MPNDLKYHDCNRDDSWWEYDGHGIPLCRVCDQCRSAKLSRYRPDIQDQYDVDEPIDPEPGVGSLNDFI